MVVTVSVEAESSGKHRDGAGLGLQELEVLDEGAEGGESGRGSLAWGEEEVVGDGARTTEAVCVIMIHDCSEPWIIPGDDREVIAPPVCVIEVLVREDPGRLPGEAVA